MTRRTTPLLAVLASSLALSLAACGQSATTSTATDAAPSAGASASDAAGATNAPGSVEIESNLGTATVPAPPTSVVALDNRTFRTLEDWGVELSGGARELMPDDIGYKDDEEILDVGNHREPNLESIVAAQPDLVISGQRFTTHNEAIAALVPDAALIDLTPREDQPFDEELQRQVTTLGEIFGKEAEADALVADLEESIERVKAAYDPEETVMGVITTGGEINYAAPGSGRSLGPVFTIAGLTPALEVPESSTGHMGDDISVEAIAESNPDWILVMDRDAAVGPEGGGAYVPANEVLVNSQALANVTAVQEGNIVYMPRNTYVDEGIQTYTEFFDSLADAMEKS